MRSTIRIGSILVLAGFLAGCTTIEKGDTTRWPDFPETPRPNLSVISKDEMKGLSPETTQKLLDNDQKLKNYAARLEAQIQAYRKLKRGM